MFCDARHRDLHAPTACRRVGGFVCLFVFVCLIACLFVCLLVCLFVSFFIFCLFFKQKSTNKNKKQTESQQKNTKNQFTRLRTEHFGGTRKSVYEGRGHLLEIYPQGRVAAKLFSVEQESHGSPLSVLLRGVQVEPYSGLLSFHIEFDQPAPGFRSASWLGFRLEA